MSILKLLLKIQPNIQANNTKFHKSNGFVATIIFTLVLLFASPAKALIFNPPADGPSSSSSFSMTNKVLIGVGGVTLAGIIAALLMGGSSNNSNPITPVSANKAITAYSINNTRGYINEATKTIKVVLPNGADITNLTAVLLLLVPMLRLERLIRLAE